MPTDRLESSPIATSTLNSVTPGFFATLGIGIVAGSGFEERDSPPARRRRPARRHRQSGLRPAIPRGPQPDRRPHRRGGSGPDIRPTVEIVGVMTDFNYRGLRDWGRNKPTSPCLASQPRRRVLRQGPRHARAGRPGHLRHRPRHRCRPASSRYRTSARSTNWSIARSTSNASSPPSRRWPAFSARTGRTLRRDVVRRSTRPTREIGIRIALGATSASAVLLGRLVESQLFDVTATDPPPSQVAALLLAFAALAAAAIPVSPWPALLFYPCSSVFIRGPLCFCCSSSCRHCEPAAPRRAPHCTLSFSPSQNPFTKTPKYFVRPTANSPANHFHFSPSPYPLPLAPAGVISHQVAAFERGQIPEAGQIWPAFRVSGP